MSINLTIDLILQEIDALLEYAQASETDDDLLDRADEAWHQLTAYHRLLKKVVFDTPECSAEQNEIIETLENALYIVEQNIDLVVGKNSRTDN